MTESEETIPYELDEILDRTHRVAQEVAAPQAVRVDREAVWPEASLRAMQEAGLGGLVAPVSAGGMGRGLLAVVQVCEMLGRVCASSAICYGMHCVGTAVIAAKHTAAQRERFLEPIARGEHLTTLALSEPGTGSHFYIPETQLHRKADGFRVTGRKTFVTNGSRADSYVLSTLASTPDAPPGTFSCVVVTEETEGVVWGEPWQGLGMRGNSSLSMDLDHAPVPVEQLLGEEGDQLWYVFQVIAPYFLMAMAGTYLGVASAAFDEARQYLGRRQHTHSGRMLAQQPVLQHRLGQLWAELERTRQLLYGAASEADAGEERALPAVLSAKAEVADAGARVVNEAMTLCGGSAYRDNGRLSRCLRDIRAAHVMAPTTDLLRTWVGRVLLNQPLLSE